MKQLESADAAGRGILGYWLSQNPEDLLRESDTASQPGAAIQTLDLFSVDGQPVLDVTTGQPAYKNFFNIRQVPGNGSCFYSACVALAENAPNLPVRIELKEDVAPQTKQLWIDSTTGQEQRKHPHLTPAQLAESVRLLWQEKLKSDEMRRMLITSIGTHLELVQTSCSQESQGLSITEVGTDRVIAFEELLNRYVAGNHNLDGLNVENLREGLGKEGLLRVLNGESVELRDGVVEGVNISDLLKSREGRVVRTVAELIRGLSAGDEADEDAMRIVAKEIFQRPLVVIDAVQGYCTNPFELKSYGSLTRTPFFLSYQSPDLSKGQRSGHYDALLLKPEYANIDNMEVRVECNDDYQVSIRFKSSPTFVATSSDSSASSPSADSMDPSQATPPTDTDAASNLGESGIFVEPDDARPGSGRESLSSPPRSSRGTAAEDFEMPPFDLDLSAEAEALLSMPVRMDYSANNGAMKLFSSNVASVAQYPGLGLSQGVTAIHPYHPLDGGNVSALSVVLQFKQGPPPVPGPASPWDPPGRSSPAQCAGAAARGPGRTRPGAWPPHRCAGCSRHSRSEGWQPPPAPGVRLPPGRHPR